MTFPFSNISGILTVQATGGSKVYSKSIFLNNFSLASGTAKKAEMHTGDFKYRYATYYRKQG
jgi:hypothetical protein